MCTLDSHFHVCCLHFRIGYKVLELRGGGGGWGNFYWVVSTPLHTMWSKNYQPISLFPQVSKINAKSKTILTRKTKCIIQASERTIQVFVLRVEHESMVYHKVFFWTAPFSIKSFFLWLLVMHHVQLSQG